MFNFIHKLFHPHCPECQLQDKDELVCPSCEVLKEEINFLRMQSQKLLETITHKPIEEVRTTAPVPVTPRVMRVPWAVKRQQMEADDRQRAEKMRQESIALKNAVKPDKSIEDLEKALAVDEEAAND